MHHFTLAYCVAYGLIAISALLPMRFSQRLLTRGRMLCVRRDYRRLRTLFVQYMTMVISASVLLTFITLALGLSPVVILLLPAFVLPVVAAQWWVLHRHLPGARPFDLLPQVVPYQRVLSIEMSAREKALDQSLAGIHQFVMNMLPKSGILNYRIRLCTEELLEMITQENRDDGSTIELHITYVDDEIQVILIDNGHRFNPIATEKPGYEIPLRLVRASCPRMRYQYMLGHNVTVLTWHENDSENAYQWQEMVTESQFAAMNVAPTQAHPLLSMKGIQKTYQGSSPLQVLKGINLEIHEGELVSIMGASGSGKSTLLNVIGILDDYDEGEYWLGGHLIKSLSDNEQAMLRNDMIGFIFQSFNLINFKNALDNVALPLAYRGVDKVTRHRLAMEYLEKVGLASHWDHKPMEMSGGQRQRVAIARALIQHPKIILADEPTGALDSKTTQEVMDMLREVNRKEGQTVIIVTHEREIADQTDRRILLKDGQIFRDERNNHTRA